MVINHGELLIHTVKIDAIGIDCRIGQFPVIHSGHLGMETRADKGYVRMGIG